MAIAEAVTGTLTIEQQLERDLGTRVPNLIIAGAQKSGTTWLHRALKLHDEFFMSETKELQFFNKKENIQNQVALKKYLENFADAGNQRYVGEATPHYMWVRKHVGEFKPDPDTVPDSTGSFLKKTLPGAQVIFVLRDPVSRAVSAYHHHFAMGRLDKETRIDAVDKKYGVVDMGHYSRHIQYWNNVFDDKLHVYLYDSLKYDTENFLAALFGDLAVKDMSVEIADKLAQQKINSKRNIISRNSERSQSEFPKVTLDEIRSLVETYEEDISFVESYLSVDLSHWRDAEKIESEIIYR